MQLLHVFLHVLDRLAEVVGYQDFAFHVAPSAPAAFDRSRLEFGDRFAALGDDEGLAGAGLAEEAGEVGLGFVGADFLHAGSGLHETSLLSRPVGSSGAGEWHRHLADGIGLDMGMDAHATGRAAKAFSGG